MTDSRSRVGLVKRYATDDWVLGDSSTWSADSIELTQRSDSALRDTTTSTAWDRVLTDLELVPPNAARRHQPNLELLGGPASPLRRVAEVIGDNTNLAATAMPAIPVTGAARDGPAESQEAGEARKDIPTGGWYPCPRTPAASLPRTSNRITVCWKARLGQRPIDRVVAAISEVQPAWLAVVAGGDITKASDDPSSPGRTLRVAAAEPAAATGAASLMRSRAAPSHRRHETTKPR